MGDKSERDKPTFPGMGAVQAAALEDEGLALGGGAAFGEVVALRLQLLNLLRELENASTRGFTLTGDVRVDGPKITADLRGKTVIDASGRDVTTPDPFLNANKWGSGIAEFFQ